MSAVRSRRQGTQDWSRSGLVAGVLLLLASAYVVYARSGDPTANLTNLDRVVTDLEQRVHDDPQNAEVRLAVALAYAERGLNRDAAAQFEQALVLAPDAPAALIGLARTRYALGDITRAREAYARVAELNADNPQRYSIEQLGGVYYELGRIALDGAQPAEARNWLREALKVNRTDADALRMLGLAHQRLGEIPEAETAFFGAVRLVPNYREVYEALETLYVQSGDQGRVSYARGMLKLADRAPQDAVALLEQATAARPDMAQAHEGLGIAYEAVARKPDALRSYQRALAVDADMFVSGLAVERLTAAGTGQ